jgi:6-pyruvoyltetrahydropterin/6-carboxytetrahydropterin synthase
MDKWRITKEFHFSAGHHLTGMREGHPCSRPHGHNYVVTLVLEGVTDDRGIVVDYTELDDFKALLDREFDHRYLNDVLTVNPTAENLAGQLFWRCAVFSWGRYLTSVIVQETPKTSAAYTPVEDEREEE